MILNLIELLNWVTNTLSSYTIACFLSNMPKNSDYPLDIMKSIKENNFWYPFKPSRAFIDVLRKQGINNMPMFSNNILMNFNSLAKFTDEITTKVIRALDKTEDEIIKTYAKFLFD